jgi:hypothetical protein
MSIATTITATVTGAAAVTALAFGGIFLAGAAADAPAEPAPVVIDSGSAVGEPYVNGLADEQEAAAAQAEADRLAAEAAAAEAARIEAERIAAEEAARQAAAAELAPSYDEPSEPAPSAPAPAVPAPAPAPAGPDPDAQPHTICEVLADGTQVPCQ